MPVGSVLLSYLSDDPPRGRRRADPWKLRSRSSLRDTNLSRERQTDSPCCRRPHQGRRYFPYSTQSSFVAGTVPSLLSTASVAIGFTRRSSSRCLSPPEQLGLNMTGKFERPPSPRHKVYVRPPRPIHSSKEQTTSGRGHAHDGRIPHLQTGSLIPKEVWRTEVEDMNPMVLKPVKTGIRTFKLRTQEKTPHRGVQIVSPTPGATPVLPYFVENVCDDSCGRSRSKDGAPFPRYCKEGSTGRQKSSFSLTHSEAWVPPSYKRQLKRVETQSRSSSVDIITWRDAGIPMSAKKETDTSAPAPVVAKATSTGTNSSSVPTRAIRSSSRMNQSHFTLAFYSGKPPETSSSPFLASRKGISPLQRSSSVDIISWRGGLKPKNNFPSPRNIGRRSGSCMPPPRTYNIISGSPL